MDAYIYNAALYCETCAAAIKTDLREQGLRPDDPGDETSYDSSEWPKGPYMDGGGESDSPECCDGCSTFLENTLTSHGYEYLREMLADAVGGNGGSSILAEWAEFYGAGIDWSAGRVTLECD